MPAGSTTRGAVNHTLDISELYVRLVERMGPVAFDREPWCHIQVGHMVLKPDAAIDFGNGRTCVIEVDRGPERRPQLVEKLNRYVKALDEWDEERLGAFPQVIWTVQDRDRLRLLNQLVRRTRVPELFAVILFDEAVERLV
jgi:hypothetical protein